MRQCCLLPFQLWVECRVVAWFSDRLLEIKCIFLYLINIYFFLIVALIFMIRFFWQVSMWLSNYSSAASLSPCAHVRMKNVVCAEVGLHNSRCLREVRRKPRCVVSACLHIMFLTLPFSLFEGASFQCVTSCCHGCEKKKNPVKLLLLLFNFATQTVESWFHKWVAVVQTHQSHTRRQHLLYK